MLGEALRIPPRSDVLFGEGAIESLPGLVGEAAFVVSDPGLVAAGVTPRAMQLLQRAGVRSELFDGIGPNPTVSAVSEGAEALRGFGRGTVVAIGGGSPIDAAKAIVSVIAGRAPDRGDPDDRRHRSRDQRVRRHRGRCGCAASATWAMRPPRRATRSSTRRSPSPPRRG